MRSFLRSQHNSYLVYTHRTSSGQPNDDDVDFCGYTLFAFMLVMMKIFGVPFSLTSPYIATKLRIRPIYRFTVGDEFEFELK